MKNTKSPGRRSRKKVSRQPTPAAQRFLRALRNHRKEEIRAWGVRDITRAVAAKCGQSLKDDTGASWFRGAQPRDPEVAIALAQVLEVDPGWLYFGDASKAPVPIQAQSPATGDPSVDTLNAEMDAGLGEPVTSEDGKGGASEGGTENQRGHGT